MFCVCVCVCVCVCLLAVRLVLIIAKRSRRWQHTLVVFSLRVFVGEYVRLVSGYGHEQNIVAVSVRPKARYT